VKRRPTKRRPLLALVLVAVLFAAAAQLASVHSASQRGSGEPHGSALTLLTHHEESAVVPAGQQGRGARGALGDLLSVPLADVLAIVALLALWLTASVRRRDHLACAVVTNRRRGPPPLRPVG